MKINSHVDPNNCYILYRDAFPKNYSKRILHVSVTAVSHCGNFVEICFKDKTGRNWWSLGSNDNGIDVRLLMSYDQAIAFEKESLRVTPEIGDVVAIKIIEQDQRFKCKCNTGVVIENLDQESIKVFDNVTMNKIIIDLNKVMILSRKS